MKDKKLLLLPLLGMLTSCGKETPQSDEGQSSDSVQASVEEQVATLVEPAETSPNEGRANKLDPYSKEGRMKLLKECFTAGKSYVGMIDDPRTMTPAAILGSGAGFKYELKVLEVDGDNYRMSFGHFAQTDLEGKAMKPAIYEGTFTSDKGKDAGRIHMRLIEAGIPRYGDDYYLIKPPKGYKVYISVAPNPILGGTESSLELFCGAGSIYSGRNYKFPIMQESEHELRVVDWKTPDDKWKVLSDEDRYWVVQGAKDYRRNLDYLVEKETKNYRGAKDEFDRKAMRDKAVKKIKAKCEEFRKIQHVKVSVPVRLGEYDFDNQVFPLEIKFSHQDMVAPNLTGLESLAVPVNEAKAFLTEVKKRKNLKLDAIVSTVAVDNSDIVIVVNQATLKKGDKILFKKSL